MGSFSAKALILDRFPREALPRFFLFGAPIAAIVVAAGYVPHEDILGSIARYFEATRGHEIVHEHRPYGYSLIASIIFFLSDLVPTQNDALGVALHANVAFVGVCMLLFSPVFWVERLEKGDRAILWGALTLLTATLSRGSLMEPELVASCLAISGGLTLLTSFRYRLVVAAVLLVACAFIKYITVFPAASVVLLLVSQRLLSWKSALGLVALCVGLSALTLALMQWLFSDVTLTLAGGAIQNSTTALSVFLQSGWLKLINAASIDPVVFTLAAIYLFSIPLQPLPIAGRLGVLVACVLALMPAFLQTKPFHYQVSSILIFAFFLGATVNLDAARPWARLAAALCAALALYVCHLTYSGDLTYPAEYGRIVIRQEFFVVIAALLTVTLVLIGIAKEVRWAPALLAAFSLIALLQVPARADDLNAREAALTVSVTEMAAAWRSVGVAPYSERVLILTPSVGSFTTQQLTACSFAYPVHLQRAGKFRWVFERVKDTDWFRDTLSCYQHDRSRYTAWQRNWMPRAGLRRLGMEHLIQGRPIYTSGAFVIIDRSARGGRE